MFVGVLIADGVWSAVEARVSDFFLPEKRSIHVLPTKIEGVGWNGLDTLLVQDLSENALFQDFNNTNSAILDFSSTTERIEANTFATADTAAGEDDQFDSPISLIDTIEVEISDAAASTSEEGGDSNEVLTNPGTPEATTTMDTSSATPDQVEKITEEEESVAENFESDEEQTEIDQASETASSTTWFPQLRPIATVFEFVQAIFTASSSEAQATTTDDQRDVLTHNSATATEASADEFSELDTAELVGTSTENVSVSSSIPEMGVGTTTASSSPDTVPDEMREQTIMVNGSTTPGVSEEIFSVDVLDMSIIASSSANGDSEEAEEIFGNEDYIASTTLQFSGFGLPELDSGELMDSLQLRLSLAARTQGTGSVEQLPAVIVDYALGGIAGESGSILLEGEASNAINGGYYLMPLPNITDPAQLSELQITVTVLAAPAILEEVYIDALWLEVDTLVYDADKLKNRVQPKDLGHLKKSTSLELMSDRLNFRQDEVPQFSFKYHSEQNLPVRTLRSAFGRELVEIDTVRVLHGGSTELLFNPDITVTNEGLISVVFSEADRQIMRPGQYTIELELEEGNLLVKDSFDFQWGILAINTNQTEYSIDDTVEISLGALTPSGNTLCEAILDLYVVTSRGIISKIPVEQSGLCDGNNVVAVPDYTAAVLAQEFGEYELYLERLDATGAVIGHTSTHFTVVPNQAVTIDRTGPTRIYPPEPYRVDLSVRTLKKSFSGTLIEQVPKNFVISDTEARIVERDTHTELIWDLSALASTTKTLSYTFDAPDLSPYLYRLGPASLVADQSRALRANQNLGTSTAQNQPEISADAVISFAEDKQWQIASDATGNMIVFYSGTGAIPTDWTCISCAAPDVFFQTFVRGSSTYNSTGGSATHTHTADGSVLGSADVATENRTGTDISNSAHSHTYTPTIDTLSNLPAYRQLRLIQYTASAGEPTTLPAGVVGVFDVASSSLPTGWNRYAVHDGRYVYGEDTVGTTGGSNTQQHTISGTTGAAAGGTEGARGGGTQASGASAGHTHDVSTTTPLETIEPPYVEVLLAELTTATSVPNNVIAMWTDEVPLGWVDVSSDPADPFSGRFIKASTTYGATGGSETHSHADITSIISSVPSATTNGRSGGAGSAGDHTHSVTVSNFSTANHLPPYATAIFGKRLGVNPVYQQLQYRWYSNASPTEPPTDPWPEGGELDVGEDEAITSTSSPLRNGDTIRLRINSLVGNATATVGSRYKLQYAAGVSCSGLMYSTVGDSASTTVWRGYNNSGLVNHNTLSSSVLSSTTVLATYEEDGFATGTPNEIPPGDVAEWDFVLEHNDASAGTQYCFRMVEDDGDVFSYVTYPTLLTNAAPVAPTLVLPFDNEKTASTSPWFDFVSTDEEADAIHYQIQIDDDVSFASVNVDRDTIDDFSLFENQVVNSDKAPFGQGQQIRFIPSTSLTNGTTYFWRVRALDPDGSDQWGDWSTVSSFTVDTTVTTSTWFQTVDGQFDSNTQSGVESSADSVSLRSGSTTGSLISTPIVFSKGTLGTVWDSFSFNDTETVGDIAYHIEYLSDSAVWTAIPDADLPGNSSGFDTSPVSLLNLSTEEYGTLRIRADFTNVSGSPSLQDWTIQWGFRVKTPEISKLFPNEKSGTTTPTFEFVTTDPQSDSLTYQISWSADNTFTSSTTRTSDTDTGFVNISDGADLDPFTSGDTVQYTVQSGDALTNNTTYWWRVRAKDTTGSGVYSFWSTPQSFTIDTAVIVSTWFQTTEEQFDTDILSGTVALASDVVSVATTATEAMVIYGEGLETIPRYRQWDGSTWSDETNMQPIGAPVGWAEVKAGTTREEYVAVTIGTDADVNAQVFANGTWSDLEELTTSLSNINARGIAIAYETLSGDALVAYCDGDADPSYHIWNGTSWTLGGTINVSETTDCDWIQLASDPTSDEIVILTRGADGSQYEAQVWNGLSWGNATTFGSITESDHEGMAVAYEESGGQAIALTSDGNPARFRYSTWNGLTWSTPATQALGDDLEWAELVADEGSDELAVCYQDEDSDIGMVRWGGAAWTGQVELDTDGNAKNDPAFACVFENDGSRDNYIMTIHSDTIQSEYSFWNNSTWSTPTQINTIGDASTMSLERTGVGELLAILFDDVNDDLLFSSWDGSAWSTTVTLESNASVDVAPYGAPYALAPRNSGKEGTTIVSPGIKFTDGVGPYWERLSWNDITPGTSDILYSVQYFDGTDWEFIPDIDLSGNAAGTSTSPIDLSGLLVSTYDEIRPYAQLSCDGSNNCPELQDWTVEWAEGIMISGTLQAYDQTTNITSGSIAVAVNGVVQVGKTGSVSAGTWSIDNVTVFPGDVVTVFVNGAADIAEAVSVTKYDGVGDITGLRMYERHLSLGSDDDNVVLTNADVTSYVVGNDEDVFIDGTAAQLTVCGTTGCADAELYIGANTVYQPQGMVNTHDIEIDGTLLATSTVYVTGSWDNNATTTLDSSTVVFSATSSTESIDTTTAAVATFGNVFFGTTSGAAIWDLQSNLDINGDLTVATGTLNRLSREIQLTGDLLTQNGGQWQGVGTTTFTGNDPATWGDTNPVSENIGRVVIDGASKAVSLSGNVAAQSILISTDDTLDVSTGNYTVVVFEDWNNQNNFIARQGLVDFQATTSGQVVTTGNQAFYDLLFSGIAGTWSINESAITVTNDLAISDGTLTLPVGTTTVGGSFDATNGVFLHNNGVLYFTSSAAETITYDGNLFTNTTYDVVFDGSGAWAITDASATTSNDLRILSGTVTLPSDTLAIGGTVTNQSGTFLPNSGTVRLYSANTEVVTAAGSSFFDLVYDGPGSWSFADTNVTVLNDLTVAQGTSTFPSGILVIGGSYQNSDTVIANNGNVLFNAATTGETINFGNSELYNVTFDNVLGGWTLTTAGTSTNVFTIANASDWTLDSGQSLAVGQQFINGVGGASTTWTGSTLSLYGGAYTVNDKVAAGDIYESVLLSGAAQVRIWNSDFSSVTAEAGSALYSMDHAMVDGSLYVYGEYENVGGTEYWSYATDFDGVDLSASSSERQVQVSFDAGASAVVTDGVFEILGDEVASTTISNQGSGTYVVSVSGGTTTAQFYEFTDLGTTGLSLLDGAVVTTMDNGRFVPALASASALTISSTTINANPDKQLFNVFFATTTAISATNVTQTDGTPAAYWWFRNGAGNLYGEAFDNDTGDPGSVRFDDSQLEITISGTVYGDAGVTTLGGSTCDNSTPVVSLYINGVFEQTVVCDTDGSYTLAGVTVVGDPTLTVFLDNAPGGEIASVITRTPTTDITDLDLYANRVIVRNEDVAPVSIVNLAVLDSSDDADLAFQASTSSVPHTLEVAAGNELFVFASSTFRPGGEITLNANASTDLFDGTLYLDSNASLIAQGTEDHVIGGRFEGEAGSSLVPASSTLTFVATTTGKSITAPYEVTFHNLTFNGIGGGWHLGADIALTGDMLVATGTVTGTGDIRVESGTLTGDGVLSLGAGTTTLEQGGALGGAQAWTFYSLVLGDGVSVGTTSPVSPATTTVAGQLVVETAHFLDAGSTVWNLTGAGDVFLEDGVFLEDTSTFTYSGAGANVLNTQYYNLRTAVGAGSAVYVADGPGLIIDNDLFVGGASSTFDLHTNNVQLDVNGDIFVDTNGTLSLSSTASTTVAGSYDNNGDLFGNGGVLTFDGSGAATIAAGSADFSSVHIDGTGSFTLTESATATADWRLVDHAQFTVDSAETLAVGGAFFNTLGGSATTWTGTTLRLFGGDEVTLNTKTTADSYATLAVASTTQVRMWNSDAATYAVDATASLYSQDHANSAGDLYIWGAYQRNSGADYWSYATDFDGADLSGGSERAVDVFFASGASATILGGELAVLGSTSASTTLQNQGAGTYALRIGGTASTSWSRYVLNDADASGLVFSGTPQVETLSFGDFQMSQTGGTAITLGGSVITANPAKTFTNNVFDLAGVGTGFNVTATGTALSSWRFTNHTGSLDGEANDSDPDGDPGYVVWDDSAATISITGTVYTDEGTTPAGAGVCDGALTAVRVVVAGLTTYDTTCAAGTGVYTVSGVSYSPGDSIIAYVLAATGEEGAVVTVDPVSNINNMDIYVNRTIVRHESSNPITIADMSVYDSSNDVNIPFTAVDATPDTLTLPADRKLIVWNDKEFAPGGDVTVSSGGVEAYGGSLQLYSDAIWTGADSELLTIGGSMILDANAVFVASNGTTTFTTTGTGRVIDSNESVFRNVAFTGSGDWTVNDPSFTIAGTVTQSAGTLTLPAATTTVAGSWLTSGGSFDANGGLMLFTSTSSGNSIQASGSDFNEVQFVGSGGAWTMLDVNATATDSVLVSAGSLTLPSGTFAIDGSFTNEDTLVHSSGVLALTGSTTSLTAGGSDLSSVYFTGAGPFSMTDTSLALVNDLVISNGLVTLASGTLSIGGSFDATLGTFAHATGTILFNSTDTGETINPGVSDFYNVVIANAAGGWTITGNATTTNSFALTTAAAFAVDSGVTLNVGGVFSNAVGGAATTWSGATLRLLSGSEYEINAKTDNGDNYENLELATDTDISMWHSVATSTVVPSSSSLYSQDHAAADGSLYIYGDYHIATTTEYWSYATDFDGTDLSGGNERQVTVAIASSSVVTLDGGNLYVSGDVGNESIITNQGVGTYSFAVTDGLFDALYYQYRNLDATGLSLTSTPTIASLSEGDFELAVDSGVLMSLSSTTLNANASLLITNTRFATTTAITGNNVVLTGTTANAWTFVGGSGNLKGEDYDVDGITDCGSVRWDDSSCQLVQQTHYRWRNDDGGLEVPDSEWFNTNWTYRKMVRIENVDTQSYTNAAVQLFVDYDADMQVDFEDLRFTDSSGTTTIPHWFSSTTNSVQAEVWVALPSLPAEDTATIFMYYNNASASSTSSSTETFVAADDFEDGNITEYSGETADFSADGTFAFDGSNGLKASDASGRTESGGMFRFDQTVSQGETIRFHQYVDTSLGSGDETCTMFGVQSPGTTNQNYAVCLEQFGTDRITLVKDVVDNDTSGTELASSTVTYSTGWYAVEVDWATDDTMSFRLYDPAGAEVASSTGSDAAYTSGGFGFTYWFQNGGWDSFTSRPTLISEPQVRFGVEQGRSGASYAAALDTPATSFTVGDVARLRVAVENSGLAITNQEFLLEYAEQGSSPSCEAVDPADFVAVPNQASCGTAPVCMTTSSNVTNGAATVDLLFDTEGDFVAGEAREDPDNDTGPLNVNQNFYTELEYVITPTANVSDENTCFRVTNGGADLDTYLRVAKMQVRFDPVITAVTLNNGSDISLNPGATTTVFATGTVTDLNGFADLNVATATIYRSGAGALCTADDNDCYIATSTSGCQFTNCSGNSCTLSCSVDMFYHADATDVGTYAGEEWLAYLEASDTAGGSDLESALGVELLTLRALEVDSVIDYGALSVNSDTGATNTATNIQNLGNESIDVDISGTDLSDGAASVIPATEQLLATSTFTYSTCTTCSNLTALGVTLEVDLNKPIVSSPFVSDEIYWGIAIPFGTASNPHTGSNLFTAVGD